VKTADAVAHIASRLAAAGIEESRREARLILAAALQTDATALLRTDDIDPARFEALVRRREAREPLAYITGHREFWSLNFATSPATLIPRPDSETLIEAAIARFPDKSSVKTILDLGTGTGCLLLAALSEFQAAFGIGLDLSPDAASLAAHNAKALNLTGRAAFLTGDWANALNARFDLVLANPPYIPAPDLTTLMPEVRNYEPVAALDGGPDGLSAYRAIITILPALLTPAGAAIIEVGVGQLADVTRIAETAGFTASWRPDLANHPRALVLGFK
jgi:release factor glutamine methyltransferase